jgi:hypothetical protein
MTTNERRYQYLMSKGVNNKKFLLQFVNPELPIIDVGSSTGAFTQAIAEIFPNNKIYALEPWSTFYSSLCENVKTFINIEPRNETIQEFTQKYNEPYNIIFSSVIHHLIKYREDKIKLFDELFDNLPKETRIIIRDGVRPDTKRASEIVGFRCTPESLELSKEFFKRFKKEFPLLNLDFTYDGATIFAPYWLICEMMFTITWGWESLERETKEHYTIFSLEDYLLNFIDTGWEVIYAERIYQPDTHEYLQKLGRFISKKGYELPLPATNQILAFKKV